MSDRLNVYFRQSLICKIMFDETVNLTPYIEGSVILRAAAAFLEKAECVFLGILRESRLYKLCADTRRDFLKDPAKNTFLFFVYFAASALCIRLFASQNFLSHILKK